MKKSFLLILLLILCVSFNSLAQSSAATSEKAAKQLGVTASMLGGTGLYYLAPLTATDHLKLTGILFYSEDDTDKDTYFSLGAEYQHDVYTSRIRRAYFTAGGYVYNETFGRSYGIDSKERYSDFTAGLGLGVDLGNSDKGLLLNLVVSYQLKSRFEGDDDLTIGLGVGIGLGFNF
ncbi:MAG: hypothetical protein FH748_00250 [Balneolaceae bacterium]|nr:hypothetical protein [Balneolaceae bacterium]